MRHFLTIALLNSIILLIVLPAAYAQVEWAGMGDMEPASAEALFHSGQYTEIEFSFSGVFSQVDKEGKRLFSTEGRIFSDIPSITKLAAIPANKQVRLEVMEEKYQEIDFTGYLPQSDVVVEAGRPAIMRDLRLVPVTVYPLRPSGKAGKAELLTSAVIRLYYEGYSGFNNKEFQGPTSETFRAFYEQSVVNYDWLDGGFEPFGKGSYLIIIPTNYSSSTFFSQFVNWKKMKGYHVIIHELTSTPSSWTAVKQIIQDYYNTAEPPLEYVLLVGDKNGGSITIPCNTVPNPELPSEYDVTDHSYTLLDGSDDYFSDVLIGRLSVSSSTEANVVFNKILLYEKTPHIGTDSWHKRMTSIGGNYNDSGPAPITPCQTAIWIADYFLDYGFLQADTILYWGTWSPGGGAAAITSAFNAGRGFVSYRGWGNSNGWMFPYFTITHIGSLTNGYKLPVVASFVCGTGDFGSSVNPSFGELIVRFGSINNAGAGVSFYGPSDHYTSTNHNNALAAGFFEGFWEEGMVKLGQAAFFSKLTMWEAFPNHREPGQWVPFYFHVYNTLGDPEMDMWNDVPKAMDMEAPDTVSAGAASLPLIISENGSPLQDAYVTVLHNDTLIAADYSQFNGQINLCFDPLSAGELTVTATKYGYIPQILTIPVQSGALVGYYDDMLLNESHPDGSLNPGETATLRVMVKNYGSAGVSLANAYLLAPYYSYLNFTPSFIALGPLAAGAVANADFNLTLSPSAPSNAVVEFTLNICTSNAAYSSKFELVVHGSHLEIEQISPYNLDPGQNESITITLTNTGDFPAAGVSGNLYSFDEAVSIINGSASFGDIPAGGSVSSSSPFVVQAAASAYEGRMLQMKLDLTPVTGPFQTLTFDLVVGYPDSTDPGGPDAYGYFVYDDGDAVYQWAPEYDWIELDPNYGGSGQATRIYLTDDSSTYVPLPFDFTFYGETYDHIMICSNGWVSFDSTWMADFRNWDLPSPLGPPTVICAFWDDLKDTVDGVLDIYYWHDPAGKFIIEWSRVHNRYVAAADRMETFELILLDAAIYPTVTNDGNILVQINEVNDVDLDNNYCTIGLEDWGHQIGLEYVYAKNYNEHPTSKELHDEMAILFTTNPPDVFSGVEPPQQITPNKFSLKQNYPNPFNSSTKLNYEIAQAGMTELKVYDISGRLIKTLFSGYRAPGVYEAVWRGDDLKGNSAASGVYFMQLKSGEQTSIVKGILLK